MVGKNNSDWKRRKQAQKIEKYGIRRFKVGVASVVIGAGLFLAGPAIEAQEVESNPAVDTAESSQAVDDEALSATKDEIEDENKTVPADVSTEEDKSEVSDSTPEIPSDDDAVKEIQENNTVTPEKMVAPPDANAEAKETKEEPIAEGYMRLHFKKLPEGKEINKLGLWTWGGVEKELKDWPNEAHRFSEAKKDDYGYYLDVKQSQTPGEIGYLLVDTTGTDDASTKITPTDQTVKLLDKSMNEAWIDEKFETSSFRPVENEQMLRVNYLRKDNNYENLGLWTWNDVKKPSEGWPQGAMAFDKEGKYGRYVDVPLSKGLNSIAEFLVVNRKNNTKLIEDLKFTNRKKYSQVFLREGDSYVYTNPYFIKEAEDIDPSNATKGDEKVELKASIKRDVQSNHFALLDVEVKKPDNVEIKKIIADASAIGMSKELAISPELKRIALTATHDIKPGEYEIPIRAYDQNNKYYETKVKVKVIEHKKQAGDLDWDEQVIYFMVTDRFKDGDTTNNNPYKLPYDKAVNKGGVYHGGDFKGIIEKLDYLQKLGVTAIWITPIVENVRYDTSEGKENGEYYGYHGYWASDFEKLNPHLGTLEEFHELIDKAAERNIRIMVDVVLNHAGYGMKKGDKPKTAQIPTEKEQEKFDGMIRKEDGLDADTQRSLSGLPDFETERHEVRDQLVKWQASWLEKATTKKGNSIYGFRVDTVKNVDDTTWQHFKNVLAEKDSDFHLIGESWGASYKNTNNDLGDGKLDSLLDFGFKDIAKKFVNGQLEEAEKELIERNKKLTSAATLGQFLSSHDEDGFLDSLQNDKNKQKIAATLQLTAKGQPVIYYGEEIGHTGKNNWPFYTNRYDFDWSKVEGNDLHKHYQTLLAFRKNHSELLARGERSTVAGSNDEKWLMTKREFQGQKAYVGTNLNDKATELSLEVSSEATEIKDHYTNKTYKPTLCEDGKYRVALKAPSISEGGTLLLTATNGDIQSVTRAKEVTPPAPEAPTENEDVKPVEDGYVRMHFKKLPDQPQDTLGLWLWGDVEKKSEDVAAWPNGATSFANAKKDSYGYYLDVKKSSPEAKRIDYLINNKEGKNLTENKSVELISPNVKEVWLDENYGIHYYKPLAEEKMVRVNYFRKDGKYDDLGLWTWGSSATPGKTWPKGLALDKEGKYGRYVDVPLKDLQEFGFLIVNQKTGQKTQEKNYEFKDLANHSQLFVRDDDSKVYTNPHYISQTVLNDAELVAENRMELGFTNLDGIDEAEMKKRLSITSADNKAIDIQKVEIQREASKVIVTGDFKSGKAPYTAQFEGKKVVARTGWKLTDAVNGYDGELGAKLDETGANADAKLWAPSAESVSLVVYDKDDNEKEIGRVALTRQEKGVWQKTVNAQKDLGIESLHNYAYHYEVVRNGKKYLVLDPYAKSMAAWNSDNPPAVPDGVVSKPVGKAAFVAPEKLGPALDFAKIKNFKKREDAVIYEAHVRDFTSDPNIKDELKSKFGTYKAFIERLDYLKELGVTHIQLLPIMNYYYGNELDNQKRLTEYKSGNSNYNWGYDPQHYFSLTGMYSENPKDPSKRIEEFKELVNEIHKRGMGVILDVVYNHTAALHVLEDIEPNYYHFMNSKGVAKESFGGGRLGTTHKMSRRLLVDSIKYLTEQFKIDGYRFDMMGDHDAKSIQEAFDAAKAINPNMLMLGEGWKTYTGDDNHPEQAADQSWMSKTDSVGSFSDEMRNELKSGYGSEGQPRFLTNGARSINTIFNNILGRPGNFNADDPGDVVQYIAAHDNLTLYDVIAQSIKKDPKYHNEEILKRVRLGNSLILTAQGTPFIHSGQEYGRTKQFLHPDYKTTVDESKVPNKSTYLTDEQGKPFEYPYFIHDSYDSSDAVNRFDWQKVTDREKYAEHVLTKEYTKGLIAIRRSTDAFSRGTKKEIDENVKLITVPNNDSEAPIKQDDLVVGYQAVASNGDIYAVFVNADKNKRKIKYGKDFAHLKNAKLIADGRQAGLTEIAKPQGVAMSDDGVTLDGLTTAIMLIKKAEDAKPEEEPVLPTPDKEKPAVPDEGKSDSEKPSTPNDGEGETNDDSAEANTPKEDETPDKSQEGGNAETPGESDGNGEAEAPGKSDGNGEAEVPGKSDGNGKTDTPEAPSNKDEAPEQPSAPEVPKEGETSGDSDTPGASEKPGEKGQPEAPKEDGKTPGTPEAPGKEDGKSEAPGTKGDTPNTPNTPEAPVKPEAPGESDNKSETPEESGKDDVTLGESDKPGGEAETPDAPKEDGKTPGTPEAPGKEDGKPEVPEETGKEERPGEKEKEQPGTKGDTPNTPNTPGAPDKPEVPGESDNKPETPEESGKDDVTPGESDKPGGEAETPEKPKNPKEDGKTPGTPEAPDKPEVPGESDNKSETPEESGKDDVTPGESDKPGGEAETSEKPKTPKEDGKNPGTSDTPGTPEAPGKEDGKPEVPEETGKEEQPGEKEKEQPGTKGDTPNTPNTPGVPDKPEVPGESDNKPETPEESGKDDVTPGESDKPGGEAETPDAPKEDGKPEVPEETGKEEQPGEKEKEQPGTKGDTPNTPNTPGVPDKPEVPGESDNKPETPEESGKDDVTPGESDKPGGEAETPEKPKTPKEDGKNPGTPDTSGKEEDTPGTPEAPGKEDGTPEVPEETGKSEQPGTKGDAPNEAGKTPGNPETPKTPSAPEESDKNDTPNKAKSEVHHDASTDVQVKLTGEDVNRGLKLTVKHVNTNPFDKSMDNELKDKDYDLYNIYFVNSQGKVEQIKSEAFVTVPRDTAKKLLGVYYVATTGMAEALPFETVGDSVRFKVTHFSYYALVYATQTKQGEQSGDGKAQENGQSGAENTPDKGQSGKTTPNDNGQLGGKQSQDKDKSKTPDAPGKNDSTQTESQDSDKAKDSDSSAKEQPKTEQKDVQKSDANSAEAKSNKSDAKEQSSTPAATTNKVATTSEQLPKTGERDAYLIFSAAALSILAGIGMVSAKREEFDAETIE
ncbi:pullulanase [Tuanshanicoccus lijuaniae]|uniref:pullulanase n=1 Tax=Aerococcaceae bacterium zg-1292 TaxID=2774330 RepID=UPI001BD840A6|nr:pullulanase [Aerococcaceae bacterium zg-A91]MBS4457861.1 pullulanase [Aerococcaceae bacterium zg-BR33]